MTTPYTTGTITLTNGSKTVTGTGTGWQTALIVGGVIYPQVAGNPLPISNVNSDTSITAVNEWRGANGTYSYALIRDASLDRQDVANTTALAALLDQLKSAPLSALAAIASTLGAGKVPRGLSSSTMEWFTVSDFAKTLVDDTSGAAMWSTMGGAGTLGSAGWVRFPNGLMLQWAGVAITGGDVAVAFPTTFPTACYRVLIGSNQVTPGANTTIYAAEADQWTQSGFAAHGRYASNGGEVGLAGIAATYLGIGS